MTFVGAAVNLSANSDTVHYRCDVCRACEPVPAPNARKPIGWLTIGCYGREGQTVTQLCKDCVRALLVGDVLYKGIIGV